MRIIVRVIVIPLLISIECPDKIPEAILEVAAVLQLTVAPVPRTAG